MTRSHTHCIRKRVIRNVRLKAEGEAISIEVFIRFYTNILNIEKKAQCDRKQAKPNGSICVAEGAASKFRVVIGQTTHKSAILGVKALKSPILGDFDKK